MASPVRLHSPTVLANLRTGLGSEGEPDPPKSKHPRNAARTVLKPLPQIFFRFPRSRPLLETRSIHANTFSPDSVRFDRLQRKIHSWNIARYPATRPERKSYPHYPQKSYPQALYRAGDSPRAGIMGIKQGVIPRKWGKYHRKQLFTTFNLFARCSPLPFSCEKRRVEVLTNRISWFFYSAVQSKRSFPRFPHSLLLLLLKIIKTK